MYATTQNDAESFSRSLNAKGIESQVYHAGLLADKRKEVQNWFMKSDGVVVATIGERSRSDPSAPKLTPFPSLRDGDRQGKHPSSSPRVHAQDTRELLPGDRARWQRWSSLDVPHAVRLRPLTPKSNFPDKKLQALAVRPPDPRELCTGQHAVAQLDSRLAPRRLHRASFR